MCERLDSTPSPPSSSTCMGSIPPSSPSRNSNTVLPKSSCVISPVSKDARAKKHFEGTQVVAKQRKNQLWAQAITGVGQLFYNGVQEVRNAVARVCFENGHEPDAKTRKSEPSRYTVRCKNMQTAGCPWEFHAKSINKDNSIFEQNLPIHGDDQLYPYVLDYWRHAVYALTEVKDLIDLDCEYVVTWMERQGPEHWSNAFFKGCRWGEVASSVAESFNSWIKDLKNMPVSALVNTIRRKMMEMISEQLTDEGNSWTVYPAGDLLFEVVADHGYEVNLETKYCSCNRWKVYGFPCSHAIQCILGSGRKVYEFVYEIDGNARVIPPPRKKLPGRPKSERMKKKYVKQEKKKRICSNCKLLCNHNSRTFPLPKVHNFSEI
ncbi:hypothetical protein MKW98_000061 [Papaver atlanticum]|uniref:SWIM-type domain-containing protein n=1 Tax=Papaver atlanticum TaxID=357466 RepID=A0AAD4XAD2_9MAGN|nr:hypothetical protein MKW98_000061 [Papaver atlanticum]